MPSVQSEEGQPAAGRVGDATAARSGASQVRVLDPHAEASARALAAGLVAEVPAGRPDPLVATRSMFRLTSEYSPRGDQPQAIADLARFVRDEQRRHTVLRGVTG